MTIDNSQIQPDPAFPDLEDAIPFNNRLGNVRCLSESIGQYLNFSLGQNGHHSGISHALNGNRSSLDINPNHAVTIYTLGHFSIQSKKQNLSVISKGQHKPIEMLKALIALGGKDVGEMRICEALWPDTDGDIAHSAFSVTLHRLRKLTGHDAVTLSDGRLTLNAQYCWVDVWVCEHLLNMCSRILSNTKVDQQLVLQCIESAMYLYNGPFLGNEDEQPWYIMFRQRLHSKMLRSLLNVCAILEANNECNKAMDLYQKGIELEPLAEEFYFRLMKCLAAFDRKAEAISLYLRCRKIFQTAIGVGPSRATDKLYRSLLY